MSYQLISWSLLCGIVVFVIIGIIYSMYVIVNYDIKTTINMITSFFQHSIFYSRCFRITVIDCTHVF